MNISSKFQVLTRFIGRSKLKLAHSSPTILTVAGVGGLIAASVTAVKVSHKMEQVAFDLEEGLKDIKLAEEKGVLHRDDVPVAKVGAYLGFTFSTLKVYALPIALGCAGTAAILYSHGIMRKREASLMAAYGVLERAYNSYRERVRESYGEEAERDLYDGKVLKNQQYDKESNSVKYDAVQPEGDDSVLNEYRREFNASNRNWNEARAEWNLVFLRSQEKYANHLLQSRGHVFLNDVFDSLGFPRTPAGAVTGWVRNGPDGYIDFGLVEPGSPEEQDYFYFFDGEQGIVMNFNVDGLIYDKI